MRYGEGDILLQFNDDLEVRWVRNGKTVRAPRPLQYEKSIGVDFVVAGASYRNLRELCAETVNESRRLYRDIHGRYVLDMKEHYPVFDSYDAAYEDRYYHWYLILEADRLSLVYSDDGQGGITVTEDLETIPFKPYDILNFWHCLDEDGILRL